MLEMEHFSPWELCEGNLDEGATLLATLQDR